MTKLFSIIFALLFFNSNAHAALIKTIDAGKIYVVAVTGAIESGDATTFRSALKGIAQRVGVTDKGILVDVSSGGGLIGEALDMANMIKENHIPLSVSSTSECLSACFLMFLAAPNKLLAHGARIGVHSAATVQGSETDSTKATTIEFARIAKENGAPNSVVGKLVSAKPNEMLFLSEDEMKQMGAIFIDDDIAPRSTAPSAQPPAPPQVSGGVSSMPPSQQAVPSYNSSVPGMPPIETKEDKDSRFTKYWGEKIVLSKAQHNGRAAAEKRCNRGVCVIILAYYDKAQRYIEIWKYDEPPKGDGRKLVCRQDRYQGQLTCTDWYDEHSFVIGLDHYIGVNSSDPVEDFLRIFD